MRFGLGRGRNYVAKGPFGEELFAGVGIRSMSNGYSGDSVRQKYTSKERDDETGLDYFGARYYSSLQGRFIGADDLLSSGRPWNPQTWNRYAYVLNNPLFYTDPSGFYDYASGTSNEDKLRFEAQLKRAREQLDKIKARYGANSAEYNKAKLALDAYGKPGDKNGVIVGFGATADKTPGETRGLFGPNGEKAITVTIDMSKNKSDNKLLGTIAHEGSHVNDRSDLYNAILGASSEQDALAAAARVTHGATETTAYTVESVFAEFTYKNEALTESAGGTTVFRMEAKQEYAEIGGTNVKIWDPSWAGADVAKIRANRAAAISKGLRASPLYNKILNDPILKIK